MTYLIDIDRPIGNRGPSLHIIEGTLDDARAWVGSQMTQPADAPFSQKTIFGIRCEGSRANDWLERVSG